MRKSTDARTVIGDSVIYYCDELPILPHGYIGEMQYVEPYYYEYAMVVILVLCYNDKDPSNPNTNMKVKCIKLIKESHMCCCDLHTALLAYNMAWTTMKQLGSRFPVFVAG